MGSTTSPVSRNDTGSPVQRSVATTPSGIRISSKRCVLSSPARNGFIRSLAMNPIRQRLQRATSLIRMEEAARAISSGPEPLA